MNSFSGSNSHRAPSSATGASFDSYQFDFGIAGSARGSGSRPIKDQKPSPHAAPASRPSATPAWSHQPSRPSWTPAVPSAAAPARSGNLGSGHSSMVGDIFGKSWASPASSSGVGIPKSDPNLFSDLVGSALGQGRGGSGNVPLKSAAPRNTFSMGNLSDSLPKPTTTTSASAATASSTPIRSNSWGSTDNSGNFSSFNQSGPKLGASVGGGGQPMKSVAGVSPASTKRDPFGSLFDIGSKPSMKQPSSGENLFNMSSGSTAASANVTDFSFGAFQNANPTKMGDHGKNAANFSSPPPPQQPTAPASGTDPLDMFFSPSAPSPAPGVASEGPGSQQFSEMNDWDMSSDFGGNNSGGATTEIDGLPPPPSGVTAPAAKTKGQDNYKQGQYADAIKWLSWAVVLLERSGDKDSMAEVLSCRASCYKEVGEYKKAVADCSKVLDKDTANVSMLVQRALLYESMEKYRLGAEDLRTVLKIDPGNRIARSTIHRLNKFAD